MAIRYILREGDASLLKKSRVITGFDRRLHELIDDMRETLIAANGLGLAAPQVGVLRRVALIVDMSIETENPEEQIIELVNPEILEESGEDRGVEGCLSVPGHFGLVNRPIFVRIKAQDRNGNVFELCGKEMTARAVCHELDHLNGVLYTSFIDKFLTREELDSIAEE